MTYESVLTFFTVSFLIALAIYQLRKLFNYCAKKYHDRLHADMAPKRNPYEGIKFCVDQNPLRFGETHAGHEYIATKYCGDFWSWECPTLGIGEKGLSPSFARFVVESLARSAIDRELKSRAAENARRLAAAPKSVRSFLSNILGESVRFQLQPDGAWGWTCERLGLSSRFEEAERWHHPMYFFLFRDAKADAKRKISDELSRRLKAHTEWWVSMDKLKASEPKL